MWGGQMISCCPLCKSERRHAFNAVLLKKHAVEYYYCKTCGSLQTQEPYWLAEAYSETIGDADTGLVTRNQGIARKLLTELL
jgi:hypothetical protein